MKDYVVQNQNATKNEWCVAQAFERLKIPYIFQFAPWGTYGVRGQYVVDFLIQDPEWQPVEIFGEYWHTGQLGAEDKLRMAVIAQYFSKDVIILWGRDTETVEDAVQAVRKEIRIGL